MNDTIERDHDTWSIRVKVVFIVFAAIAGYFLLAEHRAHLVAFLPWLLLAAGPLMHIFMHHGHGYHRGHGAERPSDGGVGGMSAIDPRAPPRRRDMPGSNEHSAHGGRQ